MMLNVVLLFLFCSVLLYVLLAGADFGAGIVELFSSEENQERTKKTLYRVMGPVWEANHIWIIIAIVILWVGFPKFYNVLVVYLHMPITIILIGITLRGVAFVFRHYDAFVDDSQKIYDGLFRFSSLLTPIFIGITFGAMISGKIIVTDNYQENFYQLFVAPWCDFFALMVGLFFAALCAFLSSVMLIGESGDHEISIFIKKATVATISVVVTGFLLLIVGYIQNIIFINYFFKSPWSIVLVTLSAVLLVPLFLVIKKGYKVISRALAGAQVVLILSGALFAIYPNALVFNSNQMLSLIESKAVEDVIYVLGVTLLIGGGIILPGLLHLLKSFKLIKILDK